MTASSTLTAAPVARNLRPQLGHLTRVHREQSVGRHLHGAVPAACRSRCRTTTIRPALGYPDRRPALNFGSSLPASALSRTSSARSAGAFVMKGLILSGGKGHDCAPHLYQRQAARTGANKPVLFYGIEAIATPVSARSGSWSATPRTRSSAVGVGHGGVSTSSTSNRTRRADSRTP
jgi:hypothetical protein